MEEYLLEPLKFYETRGRELHNENTQAHFEELLARSNMDVEANRATVKAYKQEQQTIKKLSGKIRQYKILRVFDILAMIAAVIAVIVGIYKIVQEGGWLPLVIFGVGISALVGGILLLVKCLNPKIKNASAKCEEHRLKAQELIGIAYDQTAPLNALFKDTDTLRLIEKTIPDFSFDMHFTKAHEELLKKQHDFYDTCNEDTSMLETLAGRFAGNPFLFCRRKRHEMSQKTYVGRLVISWTETYRDSKGQVRTQRRTQTLHASVVKPYPVYCAQSYLCYGSQAAPDLSFTRAPQHSEDLNEKQREKKIKRGIKRLQKKTRKAASKGGTFQEMANSEFDVLFGALDRDHEVQFRLMYTPLAQQNTVALLTSETGYGDDFHFEKRRRCNVITSEHAQNWTMNTKAANYYSYDVDEIKQKFMRFNTEYFKSVFFDFAPLIAVPAYAEEPCTALEQLEEYESHYPYYEHEVMANQVGEELFAPPRVATDVILKTRLTSKGENEDRVEVLALAYEAIDRVDVVPVFGGDGRMHPVPVPWVEYVPISQRTPMSVTVDRREEREKTGQGEVQVGAFFHGMVARILED